MFFLLFALSFSAKKFCFYQTEGKCPAEDKSYPVDKYSDYEAELSDNDQIIISFPEDFVKSDGQPAIFNFKTKASGISFQLIGSNTKVQFNFEQAEVPTAVSFEKIAIEFPNKYDQITFNSVSVLSSKFPDTKFNLTAKNGLEIDANSLGLITRIKSPKNKINLGTSFDGKYEIEVDGETTFAKIHEEIINHMIGDQFLWKFAAGSENSLIVRSQNKKEQYNIIHDFATTINLKCLYFGAGYRMGPINIQLSNGGVINIPEAMWPISNTQALVTVCGTGDVLSKVQIHNYVTPIELTGKNLEVTLLGSEADHRIFGPVTITDDITFIIPEGRQLTIDSVEFKVGATINSPSGFLVISSLDVPYDKEIEINLLGESYRIQQYPGTAYTLNVDKLNVEGINQIPLVFYFDSQKILHHNTIKINKRFDGVIPAKLHYIGDQTSLTVDLLVEKMGTVIDFVTSKVTIASDVKFVKTEPRGVNPSTLVFSKQDIQGISYKLDGDVRNYNNHFCFSSNSSLCAPEEQFLDKNDDWKKYVKQSADDFYFTYRDPIEYLIDFADFKENHPSGTFISTGSQSPAYLSYNTYSDASSLSFTNMLLFNKELKDYTIMADLSMINSGFTHVLQMGVKCENERITANPKSFTDARNRIPLICQPKNYYLSQFDGYDTITFYGNDNIILTNGKEAEQVKINVSDISGETRSILNLYTNIPKLRIDSDGSPNIKGELHFNNLYTDHELIVGNFSRDFKGLFASGINGVMTVEHGVVPIDVTGNRHVIVNSTTDVEIIYPWCTSTRIDFDKVHGHTVTWDEAYFGPGSNISHVPEDATFRIVNGYENHAGPTLAPINKMTQAGRLHIWPNAVFEIQSLTLEEEASLNIRYTLTSIPHVTINMAEGSSSKDFKNITFSYIPDTYDVYRAEKHFIDNNHGKMNPYKIPILCGEKFGCDGLNVVFESEIDTFNGTTSKINWKCIEKYQNEQNCIVLTTDFGGDDTKDTTIPKAVVYVSLIMGGVSLAAVPILIIIVVLYRRSHPNDAQLFESIK